MGMNLTLLRYGDEYLIVDCGVQFPEEPLLGIDHMLVNMDALREIDGRVAGIILTHGHEDHIGAVRWIAPLFDAPVYGTAFTIGLVEKRLLETGILEQCELRTFTPADTLNLGPFRIEFLRVTHSLPDCVSVIIHTDTGTVVHSGDFKIDETPLDKQHFDHAGFERIGTAGVDLLLSDSTNAMVPGQTLSEKTVADNLMKTISDWQGRVIVCMFASNLYRMASLFKIAKKTGRRICLVGRSFGSYLAISHGCVDLDLPKPEDMIDPDELESYAGRDVLVLSTGSQAEPFSALARASQGRHRNLKVDDDDLIIFSSRRIPGNERKVQELMNNLDRLGATCLEGHRTGMHASGHARQEELKTMLQLVRPKHFIPIHGEYAFLKAHAELAKTCGVPDVRIVENGAVMSLSAGSLVQIAEVDATPFMREANRLTIIQDPGVRERRNMACNGVASVVILRKSNSPYHRGTIRISTAGLVPDGKPALAKVEKAIREELEASPSGIKKDKVVETVQRTVRRFYKNTSGKRPLVLVTLEEI